MNIIKPFITFTLFCFSFSSPVFSQNFSPEKTTGLYPKKTIFSKKFMVVTANPYATEAGYKILKNGGNAIDAAIAVQMVLNLVEPQSSGIGGGAFLLYWDQKNQKLTFYDGRETAPEKTSPDLFLDPNQKPINFWKAVIGGRSVGVPGVLKMLKLAHEEHGETAWDKLFKDSIDLSEKGFKVSHRLHQLIAENANPGLKNSNSAKDYFYPGQKALKEGVLLRNHAFSKTLKAISKEGEKVFYQGKIGNDLVKTVESSGENKGFLQKEDLLHYQAKKREPICGFYKNYKICGAPPPSSGGMTLLQTIGILQNISSFSYEPSSKETVHLMTQAERLAYADRNRYLADPDFVKIPADSMLAPAYLKNRSKLIRKNRDMGKATAGVFENGLSFSNGTEIEFPSTSHISIVDSKGNAVSMTTSIEMAFGSTLMVDGFLLNNQLTDFSFNPEENGKLAANRVEPGKRPRSSMTPIMVFDRQNHLKLILGSPGGSQIINYIAKTVIPLLDGKLNLQEAIEAPNYSNTNGFTELEKNSLLAPLKPALEKMGHEVKLVELNSGLHGIFISPDKITSGIDPRREGSALGD